MCDCPTAGVFTSHETHRSWIIFKECKTENGTKIEAGSQRTRTTSSTHTAHTNQDIKVYFWIPWIHT
ncbi:hypothetical protein NQ317_015717 [Molorchus minor]|uniref:Uncharacterized protein n=1 Tax=Molorchus minor TaxID=1323400 RepID=A0ABQ9JM83_9CUCU|nr:hypothetical protein NQ317_015717 [Molorchus minor]